MNFAKIRLLFVFMVLYYPVSAQVSIQVWVDPDGNDDLSFVLRVAEYGFD